VQDVHQAEAKKLFDQVLLFFFFLSFSFVRIRDKETPSLRSYIQNEYTRARHFSSIKKGAVVKFILRVDDDKKKTQKGNVYLLFIQSTTDEFFYLSYQVFSFFFLW
jgi:hypothetical protein